MFYTIYKITNLLDGKIYIGSHKTKKLDDAYMGSGKYLKAAQKKYGMENFKKEILFVFDTPGEMYAKEAELVNEEFLVTENTYNLKIGGFGGWDYVNSNPENPTHSQEHMKMMSDLGKFARHEALEELRKDPIWAKEFSERMSNAQHARYSVPGYVSPALGFKHTPAAKEKIRNAARILQAGEKNSQFGTCWIYHDLVGKKKIKKDLLPLYIEQGWYKGMSYKFLLG